MHLIRDSHLKYTHTFVISRRARVKLSLYGVRARAGFRPAPARPQRSTQTWHLSYKTSDQYIHDLRKLVLYSTWRETIYNILYAMDASRLESINFQRDNTHVIYLPTPNRSCEMRCWDRPLIILFVSMLWDIDFSRVVFEIQTDRLTSHLCVMKKSMTAPCAKRQSVAALVLHHTGAHKNYRTWN